MCSRNALKIKKVPENMSVLEICQIVNKTKNVTQYTVCYILNGYKEIR